MPALKGAPTKAGDSYGKLTAVEFVDKVRRAQRWRFQCDCGREVLIELRNVRSGVTRSCGCGIADAQRIHGLSDTPEYRTWIGMRRRCYDPKNDQYHNYGGRGIRVCERWESGEDGKTGFECFLEDMGQRPSRAHTLDRTDNDGDYRTGNVTWATAKEQSNKRRTNRLVVFRGTEMTLQQACNLVGVSHHTASERMLRGWSLERALQPTKTKR